MTEVVPVPGNPHLFIPSKYNAYKEDEKFQGKRYHVKKFDSPDSSHSIVLKKFFLRESAEYSEEAKIIRRELNVLVSMNNPNIVRLLESYGGPDHSRFIITEYCGAPLYHVIRSANYNLDNVKTWTRELLSALVYLHSLDIIHRKLEPGTICINTRDNRLILQGLSKARKQNRGAGMTHAIRVDPYGALEIQFNWIDSYDEKVDIWSVAVILCEMIHGNALFQVSSMRSLLKRFLETCGPMKETTRNKLNPPDAMAISRMFTERIDCIEYMKTNNDERGRIITKLGKDDEANLRDFLERTLQLDPVDRMSADEARAHPFLRSSIPHNPQSENEADAMRQQFWSTCSFSIDGTPSGATETVRGKPLQQDKRVLDVSRSSAPDERSELPQVQDKEAEFVSEFSKSFTSVKIIGQGSFGCVFEAETQLIGGTRPVSYRTAVKRVPLQGSEDEVDIALREVAALVNLENDGIVRFRKAWIEKPPNGWQRQTDDNIVNLRTCGIDVDRFFSYSDNCSFLYIETELCKTNLQAWLSKNTDKEDRELNKMKKWFRQIVAAVGYIHEKGYVHRDLKPGNILITENDSLKICDLGIVTERAIKSSNDITGNSIETGTYGMGTEMYMAPEQMSLTAKYKHEVDIFTLGLILAQLCVVMTVDKAFEVFNNYRKGDRNTIVDEIPEVREMVAWLTKLNGAERPNCKDILAHRFFAIRPLKREH